jgi:hypothetical protein
VAKQAVAGDGPTIEEMQTVRPKTDDMPRKAGVLIGVFLLGLIPMIPGNYQLKQELTDIRSSLELSQTRDAASLAFLEASRNNYGNAAEHTSRLYERLERLAENGEGPARSVARDALSKRDSVMAMLATADDGARNELLELTSRLLSTDTEASSTRARKE